MKPHSTQHLDILSRPSRKQLPRLEPADTRPLVCRTPVNSMSPGIKGCRGSHEGILVDVQQGVLLACDVRNLQQDKESRQRAGISFV